MLSTAQRVFLVIAACFYMGAGTMHFVKPDAYMAIMPPYLPAHLAMVYLSGAAEVAGGLGLLIPALRRAAAWGLVALLIAVFPANVDMYMKNLDSGTVASHAILLARLPLQILLISWVLWCTKPAKKI